MKIVSVVGARPQFIKAGAVSRVIAATAGLTERMIHTGQHFDDAMSAVFFRELEMEEPAYNLGVSGQGHGAMTGRMLEGVEGVLLEERPDMVLVYGDTNSTLAGALAAAKLHIPVAHVEAGLRSFNRRMPEEVNRVLTDHVSALQFCPTSTAVENLRNEGITEGVFNTGDVMYDATLHAIRMAEAGSTIVQDLGLEPGEFAVCTLHRAENTDDPARLAAVLDWLKAQAESRLVVLPLHPRTRGALTRHGLDLGPLRVVEPLGYFDMHALLAASAAVFTDSGGLQKEAYFHRKPCVTLRDETEWVETVQSGWNRLWQGPDFVQPRREIAEYGEGDAAGVIVRLLKDHGART